MSQNSDIFSFGNLTALAGTAIVRTIPGRRRAFIRLTRVVYTSGLTVHTITNMSILGKTTVNGAAAAGQANVVLAADPGSIAANDFLVFEKPDGTTFTSTVNAWNSGTKTVTLNDNVPTGGLASGAEAWFYGVPGDHPNDQYKSTASNPREWFHEDGILSGLDAYAPVLVHSNNAVNAGTLDMVQGFYGFRP